MITGNLLVKEYEQEVGSPVIDGLTGLFNHGFFQLILDREIKRSERHGNPFSLIIIDIAAFSRYNLRTGYRSGDLLLKDVASIIRSTIRDIDWASRYWGDIFALLLVDSPVEDAQRAAQRIQSAVRDRYGDKIDLFFGLAGYSSEALNSNDLVAQAKEALKQAKSLGGKRIHFFKKPIQKEISEKAVVLIVDDDLRNLKLLDAFLNSAPYHVLKAMDGEEALAKVAAEDIDLILLDVMMPGLDGFEICRRLKTQERTRLIPIVLITALDDLDSRIKGMESGADDFISKPVNRIEILARVKSLVKSRRQNSRLTSIENVLFSLANAVEAKDQYTQGHTNRVASLAMNLGKKIGLGENELEALRIGGMLHDIGKIGIPEHILNKPGPLDPQEWEVMKTHSEIGHRICKPLEQNLGLALEVIRGHHEKLDQSGYPDGLPGPLIAMVARIMAVVDIFDAMTSDRPYRRALTREKAFSFLRQEVEAGKLDRKIVDCFIQLIDGQ